jgi:hypothetical protein
MEQYALTLGTAKEKLLKKMKPHEIGLWWIDKLPSKYHLRAIEDAWDWEIAINIIKTFEYQKKYLTPEHKKLKDSYIIWSLQNRKAKTE